MGPIDWILRTPIPEPQRSCKRILIPLASAKSAERMLKAVKGFAATSVSHIHLLHVVTRAKPVRRPRRLKRGGIQALVRAGDLPPGLAVEGQFLAARKEELPEAGTRIETPSHAEESAKLRAAREFDGLCRWLREEGLDTTLHVRFGNVAEEILKTCAAKEIDLVVMARSRGTTWPWRSFERTTRHVLCQVEIPVLLVHGE